MSELRINLSVSDLEKLLLDKEGNVKVEISNQIASEFAKRYLKGVVATEMEKEFRSNINSVVRRELNQSTFEFVSEMEDKLIQTARKYIESEVKRITEFRVSQIIEKLVKDEAAKLFTDDLDSAMRNVARHYYEHYVHQLLKSDFDKYRKQITQAFDDVKKAIRS